MPTKTMTTRLIDALSARTRFGELMEKAAKDNVRFLVSRRGKPKVVVLSVEDYLRNIVKRPRLLVEIQEQAKQAGLEELSDRDIEIEIKACRRSKKRA